VDLPVTTVAATRAPPAPPSTGGRGRAFGALVHRLLECADEQFAPPPRAVAAALADETGAEPSDVGPALDAARRIARHELIGRARRARRCFRELPVAACLAGAAAVPPGIPTPECLAVHGVVDLAFEEPDGWVIVDYKTDTCASTAERAARTAHYEPQLRLYADVLSTAGLTVKETHLLFVDDAPA
jgi:ATP-dependent helicase/nuclease subunit A